MDKLQAFLPRIVLYSVLGTFLAWFYHLIQPALVAALSPEYRGFDWVTGKRGVWPFLQATWNVAFKSRELFADIHRKVRLPYL